MTRIDRGLVAFGLSALLTASCTTVIGAPDYTFVDKQVCTVRKALTPEAPVTEQLELIDLKTDREHCGSCGNSCLPGALCTGGACACPGSQEVCDDVSGSRVCTDLTSSDEHCGGCRRECATGNECVGGKCACSSGMTACGDECFDLKNDPTHCGNCTTKCPTGGADKYECNSGSCGVTKTAFAECGDECAKDSDCRLTTAYCDVSKATSVCTPKACKNCDFTTPACRYSTTPTCSFLGCVSN